MKAVALFAALLMICDPFVLAAETCPPRQDAEWSAQCFERAGESRRVKAEFIKNLRTDRSGLATILIAEPRELVAVNHEGKVILPGIRHTGDFDYPNAESGIGRFYTADSSKGAPQRCGYFQAKRFRIIAPAQFDHCQPFKDGQALACTGCESYCTETDCQNSILVGGQGVKLGSDGAILTTFALPTLDNVCKSPVLVRTKALENGAVLLTCLGGTRNPFDQR